MTPVGVLALQGDFEAHCHALSRVGALPRLVRTPADLEGCKALILPGGESTTMGLLLELSGLDSAIRSRAQEGMPILGTCAGLILMAKFITGSSQPRLGLMDIEVSRNAYGRQVESFEADIDMPEFGDEPIRGVFIRAPQIVQCGPEARVIARYEGKVVGAAQGNLAGIAFHPELTEDLRVHQWLVERALSTDS